jgi:hypothetical protein
MDAKSKFSIGTKGYIGTGIDNNGNLLKDFWEWDQTTNTWTQKANFGGTAREDAVSFSIGSKGYIGTGADPSTTKDFWEYTPDSTVGINEITLKNSITVFPNPATGKFTVQSQNVKITSLEIYNVLGKMVYSKQPHSQQLNEIDISKEPEGVYFVRVYTELGMLSKKVLLVK